ncbi:MBL fold metallo-hydrolase [Desulfospira joergensenii]|uniref:MBL fold metallo-hydrolase n=1 Tax=Desulfospira joergensenii TaxID=53329 RepID=UPI000406779E|nr:MBL fold metallo-hydrolase [Desulfospira joergensenii]
MKSFFTGLICLCMVLSAACTIPETEKKAISLTLLYDNYIFTEGLKAEWGFSCLITGTEKTILFDTGRSKEIFYYNIDQIRPDLEAVSQVVISHNHSDHTGNLFNFLETHSKVAVYVPASFPKPFMDKIKKTDAVAVPVDKPIEISRDVFLTGEMESDVIAEQSLVINTDRGLVIITGCSHPGILNIIRRAKEIVHKEVYLVIGGFHLLDASDDAVKMIIREFKNLGVLNVSATHCTGDRAIELFKKAYGRHYIPTGVGAVLTL